MVRRDLCEPSSGSVGSLGARHESGSMVVAALVLALVLAILSSSVTARSAGVVLGAAAAHDRVQARTVAEDMLHAMIIHADELATGSIRESEDLGAHLLDLDGTGAASDRVITQVDVRVEEPDILVRVDVTVGESDATASARLRPRTSADLAWFAESMARDPLLQRLPRISCAWPIGHARRHAACHDMPLPTGSIGGHVHINDAVEQELAASIGARVTSSDPAAIGPAHRTEMRLPRDVATVLEGRTPTCRFRGPTLVRFDGPRIRVTSPRSVPRERDQLDASVAIGCLGVDRALLDGPVTVELPPTAVIEVIDDVDSDCVLHPLGLDLHEDLERAWRCDAGDVYVWGRYHGARSVVAHGSIQIVWDLEPGDAGAARALDHGDVLGLVAGDSLVLRRPIGHFASFAGAGIAPFGPYPLDAPNPIPTGWDTPRIVAAIVALRGSFAPQNSAYGPAPSNPVRIEGSMAARFAPATQWDILDFLGRPAGTLEFPIALTYDNRFTRHPPPVMPLIDNGRLRVVELDVG